MTTKVKFTLPLASIIGTTECILLGEFNNWNPAEGIVMKVDKDGSLYAEVELPAGQEFQYRYLLGNGNWVNDNADKVLAEAYGYPVENCIVRIPEPAAIQAVKKTRAAKPKATPVTKKVSVKDDLTRIEGIGKKIDTLLRKNEIVSYQQLAKTTVKKLKAILEEAGSKYNMHNPATWPKQAKLAAAGQWDELKAWQDELNGGK
ncbi:MAG: glycoside hydrolase family 13 [Ferruginibacter sp.]